jgi:hypothetical protein
MRKSQTSIEHEDAKLSNDPLKLDYEDYLRNQRGLSERTVYHCWRFAHRFLQFRFGANTIFVFERMLLTRSSTFRPEN